jgi:PAS domain S-box-containing protein
MGMHLYELQSENRLVFLGANPAADRILGVDNSQFIGKTIEEAFPPLAESEVPIRYRAAAAEGTPWKTQQIAYEDDHIQGAFEVYAFQTSPGKMAAMFLDTTERMQAEAALKDSKERYNALFDRSLHAVFVHDFSGKFIDANQAALQMLGYENDELPQLDFASLLDEKQLSRGLAGIQEIMETGSQKETSTYRLKTKSGGHIWVETEATLIYKKGKPFAILGIARDITSQKEAEEALRENEEKYRAIFESFYDVYYRTDRDGLVTIISPSVKTQAGYEPEDVIGHPVTDFYLDPDERETFNTNLKKYGFVNDYELQLLAKDGRVIDVSASSKIVLGKDGKPGGVEGLLRDITDRKRAEVEIKASLKEKEVLLQEIHHRVKNNMQIISSLLNLQSSKVKDKDVVGMFQESRDRIRAMALIHEKLYQAKDLAQVNLSQYIESLYLHLYHMYRIDTKAVQFDRHIDEIFLDINTALPIGLVINELVSNALKHAFPNGSQGEICLELSSIEAGKHRLIVRDNGIGLPGDLDINNPDTLGMQLVYDLVAQIGGSIKIEAKEGTTFQVDF